jgi:hypothetical protein
VGRGSAGYEIELLDAAGEVVRRLGPGAGIVAATRYEDQQPTWTVSGTDDAGVQRAARLLHVRTLRNRYAVAAGPSGPVALPATGEGSP